MIPTIVQLGPIPIHSFGLMLVLGLVAGWRMLVVVLTHVGEDAEVAERVVFWAGLGGILGARVLYLFSVFEEFINAPLDMIFSGAGFVWYGGFIGGTIAVVLLLRKLKLPVSRYADYIAPTLAVGYAVGRIGCHLSGDGDYGILSTVPWAVNYQLGVVPTAPGELVHPTPIYETLLSIGIAYALVWCIRNRTAWQAGSVFLLYVVFSSMSRFMIEFIRREPTLWAGLTQAQVISLLLIATTGLLLTFRPKAMSS